ncbi:seroin-like [Plodia interpunctella]|uniref:seroin-like n=1 Tax=Plodia interpunctella TaxID=58824 RepID=UPI002367E98A|nr:seroin-like [Plodia interpunctella]
MASAVLLITVFVAVVNAGYVWVDEEDDAPPGYKRMYVPPIMQPPPLPGFGNLPPLPQPPPLYVRDFSQPFEHFHPFPQFVPINIPSPADIKNIKSEPGKVFNGVSVKSVSGFGEDEDGKPIRTGGTTIVVNENGEVKETKVGKNPPNIEDPIVFPSFPDPVNFKPFVFKPIKFKPITFKPIDLDYKPKEGENYVATFQSKHSESSNINGVESNSGGSTGILNVNGETEKEAVEFRNDPKNGNARDESEE